MSSSYLVSLLSMIIIGIVITNNINIAGAQLLPPPVKDSAGNQVYSYGAYLIHPVLPGKSGSIKLGTDACPAKVVVDSTDPEGDGFNIKEQTTPNLYIYTTYCLDISWTSLDVSCGGSTSASWTIPNQEGAPPSNLITTDPSVPFFKTSCFVLREYPKPTDPKVPSYMLQHCTNTAIGVQIPLLVNCKNITLYVYEGVGRLASVVGAVTGPPLEFVFVN